MKILKAQDIHVSPEWLEQSKQHIARICEVAKSEKVDAITIAGDFFDKPLMASSRNNYDEIMQLGRDLQSAAQVVFCHGTPSHDAPESYTGLKDIGWKEVQIGSHHIIGDLLIIGIQELTPAVLMANYPELSKQEINTKQYELVNSLIDNYYAPLSASHSGPVLFMGHGHIAGTKFRDDQKPRSTDFMYSEEMLNRIGADSIQFGHLHLPQKYYGGSAHLTWGDLGFKPGFDVYDTETGKSERFDYGELERQKIVIDDIDLINASMGQIKANVNLWVDIECNKAFADQFDNELALKEISDIYPIGPLSKITCNIQHTESVRVDVEEYEACNTLEDLYKIYDPNVSESILLKVAEAQNATGNETEQITPHNFEFLDLYLKGSKAGLENGVEEIKIDFNDFNTGANLIIGENGTGKSFNIGFCTPFSVHLPTGADLKTLFELKDSQIMRRFRDGKDIITQKIMIDPTLASPTAKYYMDINGTAVETVTGNKSFFDDAVSDIFGSIKMFMTCAFRGQKENANYPSLENAKETDLRKIFTELSGISRAPLKEYAHEKAGVMKKEIELDVREIETLESIVEDKGEIEKVISDNIKLKWDSEQSLTHNKSILSDRKLELSSYESIISENKNIDSHVSTLISENTNLNADNNSFRWDVQDLGKILDNASSTRSELESLKKQQSEHTSASVAYFEAQGEFNKLVDKWNEEKADIDKTLECITKAAESSKAEKVLLESQIQDNRHNIDKFEMTVYMINKPCEHCGKLPVSSSREIKDCQLKIESCKNKVNELLIKVESIDNGLKRDREGYQDIRDSISEYPELPDEIVDLKEKMDSLKYDSEKLKSLTAIIDGLKSSEDKKTEIENTLSQNEKRIDDNKKRIEELKTKIKPVNKIAYETLKIKISDIETQISGNTGEIGRLTAEIEALGAQLQKSVEREEKIKTLREKCGTDQKNITEWEGIEKSFSPKGIEALELSLIAPVINREANDFLNRYQPRYSVEIITQDFDKNGKGKNLVEKFKILVHDSKASEVKSVSVVSGGQAVWSTSALREAINSSVIKRTGRNYMYGVIDEQDGALDNNIVAEFYSMLNDSLTGKKKLISVSHNIEAISTISNVVEVTDFFVKGE